MNSLRVEHPNEGRWLPDMDLNHDKQIQSLLCYRYTIGQWPAKNVKFFPGESSEETPEGQTASGRDRRAATTNHLTDY